MALVVSSEKKQWDLPKDGEQEAICVDVIDAGEQDTPWGSKRKVRFVWELAEYRKDGKPFLLNQYYTLSLHEKAQLRKDLKKWRGADLSRQEIKGFDLESMIGERCRVVIEHRESGGIVYANLSSILPSRSPIVKESGHYKRRELDEIKKKGPAESASFSKAEPPPDFVRRQALPPQAQPEEEDDLPF